MKSRFYKFVLTFIMTSHVPGALAAINKVGNGGDGVFCTTPNKNDGLLLDFYEAEFRPAKVNKSAEEIAAERIEKLKVVAPKLYEQYSRRLSEIKNEIEFRPGVELTDIPDSHHAFQPVSKDCLVLQVAIRRANIDDGEKRFLIRHDLWKRLNTVHQAGLLTHEIIYEHLMKLGEEDSIKARKINSYLYNDSNTKSFWALLKDLRVPIYP